MTPETHFADNDGVSIACQRRGNGPGDLLVNSIAQYFGVG